MERKTTLIEDLYEAEDIVDLRPFLLKYTKEKHHEFLMHYRNGGRIFTMTFDRGIDYTVKVLGEAKESSVGDPKYDVIVTGVQCNPDIIERVSADEVYPLGYTRWVRTHDLVPVED